MEPTGTEAAGDEMTGGDDEDDDDVAIGVLELDELAFDGSSSGPNTCTLEAGAGISEPVKVMTKGQT